MRGLISAATKVTPQWDEQHCANAAFMCPFLTLGWSRNRSPSPSWHRTHQREKAAYGFPGALAEHSVAKQLLRPPLNACEFVLAAR